MHLLEQGCTWDDSGRTAAYLEELLDINDIAGLKLMVKYGAPWDGVTASGIARARELGVLP